MHVDKGSGVLCQDGGGQCRCLSLVGEETRGLPLSLLAGRWLEPAH